MVGDRTTTPPPKETAEQGNDDARCDSVFTLALKARGADESSDPSGFQYDQCMISTRPEHDFESKNQHAQSVISTRPEHGLSNQVNVKRDARKLNAVSPALNFRNLVSDVLDIDAGPRAQGQGVVGDMTATPPVKRRSKLHYALYYVIPLGLVRPLGVSN